MTKNIDQPIEKSDDFTPPENPYNLFKDWLSLAETHEINDPNAMCLATATADGKPSARIMLLKGIDAQGFVFYTNANSRKGEQIESNPYASLNFHWKTLQKQVRIEGELEEVTSKESDEYYNSRPRGSRIGAWASKQSQQIKNDDDFEKLLAKYEKEFEGQEDIPRPPHWKGFRVKPSYFEFWQAGEFRIHKRHLYTPDGDNGWTTKVLYP